jgi:hypothetical protein
MYYALEKNNISNLLPGGNLLSTGNSDISLQSGAFPFVSEVQSDGENVSFRLSIPVELYHSFLSMLDGLFSISKFINMKQKQDALVNLAHSEEYKSRQMILFQEMKQEVVNLYQRCIRRGLNRNDSIRKTKSLFNQVDNSRRITCEQIRILTK